MTKGCVIKTAEPLTTFLDSREGREYILNARVKAILWTILPNVRKDALLSKQANMINKFKEVDIWNNVIIVCKQSRNPEDDTQGALYAAKAFSPELEVPVLGYTFLEDPSWTSRYGIRIMDGNSC